MFEVPQDQLAYIPYGATLCDTAEQFGIQFVAYRNYNVRLDIIQYHVFAKNPRFDELLRFDMSLDCNSPLLDELEEGDCVFEKIVFPWMIDTFIDEAWESVLAENKIE